MSEAHKPNLIEELSFNNVLFRLDVIENGKRHSIRWEVAKRALDSGNIHIDRLEYDRACEAMWMRLEGLRQEAGR